MSLVNFQLPYSNAEAERGKFVVVDSNQLTTLYNYPSGSRGRYAILTKDVDPITFPDTLIDAFGRLRTSTPETLFGSKLTYGKMPDSWDELVLGTSTSTHLSADSSVAMTVQANNDGVIRQTKQRFIYQPGKSLLTMMSFVSGQVESDVYKRVGLFLNETAFGSNNIYDGIYFESNGISNNYNLCIAKSHGDNSGTVSIPQSAWNYDKLDGSGASSIALDFSKNQIFFIDFEWLGVGSVRTGFIVNGEFYIAHIFHHANVTQGVYMTAPNLPVRYEIASVGGQGKFQAVCSSVLSEGGYQPTGQIFSISSGVSSTSLNSVPKGDIIPLISLQLADLNYGESVELLNFNIAPDGALSQVYEIMLIKNGTHSIDTGSWVKNPASALEYKINPNTNRITPGTGKVINTFLLSLPNQASPVQHDIFNTVLSLGVGILGNKDRLDVCIRCVSSTGENKSVYYNLTVRENY